MATYLTLFFCFIIFSQNCPGLKEAAVSPHGPFSLPEILPTATNFHLSRRPQCFIHSNGWSESGKRDWKLIGKILKAAPVSAFMQSKYAHH